MRKVKHESKCNENLSNSGFTKFMEALPRRLATLGPAGHCAREPGDVGGAHGPRESIENSEFNPDDPGTDTDDDFKNSEKGPVRIIKT